MTQLDPGTTAATGSPMVSLRTSIESAQAGLRLLGDVTTCATHGSPGERLPASIRADQAYYWSTKWQSQEKRALQELEAGHYAEFDDPVDMVRWLLSDDR